jgi:hypothetical protein
MPRTIARAHPHPRARVRATRAQGHARRIKSTSAPGVRCGGDGARVGRNGGYAAEQRLRAL